MRASISLRWPVQLQEYQSISIQHGGQVPEREQYYRTLPHRNGLSSSWLLTGCLCHSRKPSSPPAAGLTQRSRALQECQPPVALRPGTCSCTRHAAGQVRSGQGVLKCRAGWAPALPSMTAPPLPRDPHPGCLLPLTPPSPPSPCVLYCSMDMLAQYHPHAFYLFLK